MERLTGINRGRLSTIERSFPPIGPTWDELKTIVDVLSDDVTRKVA